MAFQYRFRWTIAGLIAGGLASAILTAWYGAADDKDLPLWLLQISAWLGFWILDPFYQGFPVDASVVTTDALLVFLGAIQWGLIGLLCDIGRLLVSERVTALRR